jgi:MFS family permease
MRKTTFLSGIIYLFAALLLCSSQWLFSVVLLYIGMALVGFSAGATPPICSAFCNSTFGIRHFPVNMSLFNMHLIPASFLGPLVSGAMMVRTGSYMGTFIMVFIFGCAGFILTRFIREDPAE